MPSLTKESAQHRDRAATSGPLVAGVPRQAFQEWWTGRGEWFTNSVKASLLIVYVACIVTFFYFHGLWTAHEWKGELGLPSPWFVSHNKPGSFYTSGLQLSSSWLVAGIGLLAYYAYYRIKMVEKRSITIYMTPGSTCPLLVPSRCSRRNPLHDQRDRDVDADAFPLDLIMLSNGPRHRPRWSQQLVESGDLR